MNRKTAIIKIKKTILILLFLLQNILFSTDITNSAFTNNINIISVTAGSSADLYPVSNIYDNDTNTYWKSSNSLNDSWIKLDLGTETIINTLRLLMNNGNLVTYPLKIYAGNRIETYIKIFPKRINIEAVYTPSNYIYCKSNTVLSSNYYEIYFDNLKTRYIKILLDGTNSAGENILGINEAEVEYRNPHRIDFVGIKVFSYDFNAEPENALDNNWNTRWGNMTSDGGFGSYYQFDLGENKIVSSIYIGWYSSSGRRDVFDLSISDNNNWIMIITNKTNAYTPNDQFAVNDFNSSVLTRYVKLINKGNSYSSNISLYEIALFSYSTNATTITPLLVAVSNYGYNYNVLFWNDMTNVLSYNIYNGNGDYLTNIKKNTNIWTNYGIMSIGKYSYILRASNEIGLSDSGNTNFVTVSIPNKPELSIKNRGKHFIVLTWNKQNNVTGYKIYNKNNIILTNLPENIFLWTNNCLSSEEQYSYYIVATNMFGNTTSELIQIYTLKLDVNDNNIYTPKINKIPVKIEDIETQYTYVNIVIFNLNGKFIKKFENVKLYKGLNEFEWDGYNYKHKKVGIGIYILKIYSDNNIFSEKYAIKTLLFTVIK